MLEPAQLPLRDVHLPSAPSLWPPAPGWWAVAAIVLAILLVLVAWKIWRHRRRQRWSRWFLEHTNSAEMPEAVSAMSALLRRAARRQHAGAELLEGEAWLSHLDGSRGTDFSSGPGRLILDGGFRRDIDPVQFQALRELAHQRFLEIMERRK